MVQICYCWLLRLRLRMLYWLILDYENMLIINKNNIGIVELTRI